MDETWVKYDGSLPKDMDLIKLEWCWRIKPTPPCPRDLWIRPSLDGKTADLLPYDKEHEAEAHWLLYKHVREVEQEAPESPKPREFWLKGQCIYADNPEQHWTVQVVPWSVGTPAIKVREIL